MMNTIYSIMLWNLLELLSMLNNLFFRRYTARQSSTEDNQRDELADHISSEVSDKISPSEVESPPVEAEVPPTETPYKPDDVVRRRELAFTAAQRRMNVNQNE